MSHSVSSISGSWTRLAEPRLEGVGGGEQREKEEEEEVVVVGEGGTHLLNAAVYYTTYLFRVR